MKPTQLYDDIHRLALDIVNASTNSDEAARLAAYAKLTTLCETNANSELDHPLQWEALGDFSQDYGVAISAYERGLQCASRLELAEYIASIKFAMAENHHEQGFLAEAIRLANEALAEVEYTTEVQLQAAIESFLMEHSAA